MSRWKHLSQIADQVNQDDQMRTLSCWLEQISQGLLNQLQSFQAKMMDYFQLKQSLVGALLGQYLEEIT